MLSHLTRLQFRQHTLSRLTRAAVMALGYLLASGGAPVRPQGVPPAGEAPATTLELGAVVERQMEGGGEHLYIISAHSEQFLQVTVQQKGIDVVLTLLAEGGELVSRVDRPNGARGKESLSALIKVSGTYKLRINSLDRVAAKGTYVVSVARLRAPLPGDDVRVRAEQAVSEGELLRARGTA